MNRIPHLTLIGFLVIVYSSNAQEWTTVFSDRIPQHFSASSTEQTQINRLIDAAATIHPELIYFELLKIRHIDSPGIERTRATVLYRGARMMYIRRRTIWAQSVLDYLGRLTLRNRIDSDTREWMSRLLVTTPSQEIIATSMRDSLETELDHVVVQHISRSRELGSLADSSVSRRREELENQERALLEAEVSRLPGGNNHQFVEDLLKKWYLFEAGGGEPGFQERFAQILIGAIQAKYRTGLSPSIRVALGFTDFLRNPPLELKIADPNRTIAFPISYSVKTIFGAVGLLVPMSDQIDPFSYLSLTVKYSRSSDISRVNFRANQGKGIYDQPGQYFFHRTGSLFDKYIFYAETPARCDLECIQLQLGFPLIVYRRWLVVEPSVSYTQLRFAWSAAADYSWTLVTIDGNDRSNLDSQLRHFDIDERSNSKGFGMGVDIVFFPFDYVVAGVSLIHNRVHIFTGVQI